MIAMINTCSLRITDEEGLPPQGVAELVDSPN